MRLILPAFILAIFCSNAINAQRVCSSEEYALQLQADPVSKKGIADAARQVTATLKQKNTSGVLLRDTTSNEIIYIPVVVHLLYKTATENISDAQVKSQIDVLNKDFSRMNADRTNTPAAFAGVAADSRIQFCLAKVDPKGQKTTGIDRVYTNKDFFTTDDAMKFTASGGAASWNSSQYLNIWVVKLNGRSLAYATPPGAAAEKDGLVISYDVFGNIEKVRSVFNKGRTATHEIGHWLGLVHTWGDALCGDDHVDDTPQQYSYNFGCPTFPKMSSCSPNANGDMFMNYMDFSDDACMNMFTKGQVKRMRAVFAQGNVRNGFLNSVACDSSNAQAGPLPDTTKPATPDPAHVNVTAPKMYPNPVVNVMTVDHKLPQTGTINLRIFTATGVLVYTKTLVGEKTTHNLSNLTRGTYLVQIANGKNTFNSKIIKL
ncbi:MAG: M43 family zinc metalloprotease [Bacteroidota bacterium]